MNRLQFQNVFCFLLCLALPSVVQCAEESNQMEGPDVYKLIEDLQSPDIQCAIEAARRLRFFPEMKEAIPYLFEESERERDWRLSVQVALALGFFGFEEYATRNFAKAVSQFSESKWHEVCYGISFDCLDSIEGFFVFNFEVEKAVTLMINSFDCELNYRSYLYLNFVDWSLKKRRKLESMRLLIEKGQQCTEKRLLAKANRTMQHYLSVP